MSFEDEVFLEIMQRESYKDEQNSWVAPLPLGHPDYHFQIIVNKPSPASLPCNVP